MHEDELEERKGDGASSLRGTAVAVASMAAFFVVSWLGVLAVMLVRR